VPSVVDQALCIRVWDWSETSQTVSLFGRQIGLLRGIAKGSKREGSPFSGGFEVLTRGEVVAIVKPSNPLATLTAWDLQETFPAVRRSLGAFYAAMYVADLVHHAIHDSDPHARLFDAASAALRALGSGREGIDQAAVLAFQWAVLSETGYRPELAADVGTGGELIEAPSYGFSPVLGGLMVDPALGEGSDHPVFRFGDGQVWRVRAETVGVLRSLDAGQAHVREHSGGGGLGTPAAIDRANRLLASYLRELFGREPPAMAALFGAGRASGAPAPG
jgi:DNA repair protein RecO (recombination protein O)